MYVIPMPNLTIYLNSELYERIKNNPSRIIQEALRGYFGIKAKIKEVDEDAGEHTKQKDK